MVGVRIRRNNHNNIFASGRGSSSGKSKQFRNASSSSSSIMRIVKLSAYLIVFIYGIVTLSGMSKSTSSSNTTTANGNQQQPAMGLSETLQKSHIRIPAQQQQQQQRRSETIEKTPKYDHHLEDPDIHMVAPPDINKEKENVDTSLVADMGVITEDTKARALHQLIVDHKGTGPNKVAYVQDLGQERLALLSSNSINVAKEATKADMEKTAKLVAAMVQEAKVSPCLVYNEQDGVISSTYHGKTLAAPCLDQDTPQIVYNSAYFPRIWCGQEIAPNSSKVMAQHCEDRTVHLFPTERPPIDGKGMPPMVLRSTMSMTKDSMQSLDVPDLESVDCDIPCKQEAGTTISDIIVPRYFEGEPWTILQTLVEPSSNPRARLEQMNFRRDTFFSTPSFKSNIPLSNFDPNVYSLRNTPTLSYEEALPKAIYMVSTICSSPHSRRHKYFASLLNKGFPVDSMGDCGHNTDVPSGKSIESSADRIEIMKKYRFVLALDKTKDKDYLSTTVWEALVAGSVPVVVSAENIRLHLPSHSYIDGNSYEGWEELADAVIQISKNKEEWESYQAWRTDDEAITKFEALYEFTKTNPTCRLCRWGYSKKYGLGWNHTTQQVSDTHIPRKLCTTPSKGLIVHPFHEEWISRNGENEEIAVTQEGGEEVCTATGETTIDNGSTYKVTRSITEHDGVIDMLVTNIERESTTQELVLRLKIPRIRNSDGAQFPQAHKTIKTLEHGETCTSTSIQDESSKVTVLADWKTTISSLVDGVIEIVVVEPHESEETPAHPLSPHIPKRVRVIVEDMDIIINKMTEHLPSLFAKKMIKDFVDPLQIFYSEL